ncbi:dimethylsulfonioproprionate lyase family protein [Nesterenkonia lutea]|uniref:Oxalate decarboxylase/phosphoglucose isomerase-like protein (Cupin superfamily) n=1 Tax=Nesterenkonia lutea TaxID=272919 RepID=A0ABR9JHW3_9MICC|nr:cupin domain-containing protein [Nesterenkonia lutea]MBE1525539.1 oxalate decarboxylase/phosphoglucose isomerase-like protein (cupin superfamily) [Nesterenkonia lutea]
MSEPSAEVSFVERHPLVAHATEEGYHKIGHGPVDSDAGVDPRDEGRIQGLLGATNTGSKDVNLGLGKMSPGDYHLRHHHPRGSEWYYFIKGAGLVHLNDDRVRVRPGTAIYIPAGTVHAVLNDGDEDIEMLWGISTGEYGDIGLVYDE